VSLGDAEVVKAQYATEAGLQTRRAVYPTSEREDRLEGTFAAIAACVSRPRCARWLAAPSESSRA